MIRFLMMVGAAMAAVCFSAAAAPVASNAANRVAIVAVGEGTAKLAEHAHAWVAGNVAVGVDLLPPVTKAGANLDAIAADAIKAAGKYARVIAIAMPPKDVTSHGMRTGDGHAAVINVRAMQADAPDATKLERRIERQAIRALSLMVDVPSCVNSQCALSAYQNLADLDATGRNLCPPCNSKVQGAADAAKIELNPDCPFYIHK